jgi:hypothetical protein
MGRGRKAEDQQRPKPRKATGHHQDSQGQEQLGSAFDRRNRRGKAKTHSKEKSGQIAKMAVEIGCVPGRQAADHAWSLKDSSGSGPQRDEARKRNRRLKKPPFERSVH